MCFAQHQYLQGEKTMRIRRVALLALFGLMAAGQPLSDLTAEVLSDRPVITEQAQFPPPPECGLYDTCKGGKKV
jgi:hypothetical protein